MVLSARRSDLLPHSRCECALSLTPFADPRHSDPPSSIPPPQIGTFFRNIDEPDAKVALLWMLAEYGHVIPEVSAANSTVFPTSRLVFLRGSHL
eukprot:scaffold161396_cov30-Tisochrysis_lutea.AAC.7